MSQVYAKSYDCMTCGQQIRLAKIDGAGPDSKRRWNKYELDGVTVHVCKKKDQQQANNQLSFNNKAITTPTTAAPAITESGSTATASTTAAPQATVLPLDVQVANLADQLHEILSYQKLLLTHVQRLEEQLAKTTTTPKVQVKK